MPIAFGVVGGDLAAQANFRASLPEFGSYTPYNDSMLELLLEAVVPVVEPERKGRRKTRKKFGHHNTCKAKRERARGVVGLSSSSFLIHSVA